MRVIDAFAYGRFDGKPRISIGGTFALPGVLLMQNTDIDLALANFAIALSRTRAHR